MSPICGNCRYYLREHLLGNCSRTGKDVGYLWERPCFEPAEKIANDKTHIDMETKTCKKCGRTLPLDDFGYNVKSADGHLGICHDCMSAMKKGKPRKKDNQGKPAQLPVASIVSIDDKALVAELRARGWDVTCRKHTIVEL